MLGKICELTNLLLTLTLESENDHLHEFSRNNWRRNESPDHIENILAHLRCLTSPTQRRM